MFLLGLATVAFSQSANSTVVLRAVKGDANLSTDDAIEAGKPVSCFNFNVDSLDGLPCGEPSNSAGTTCMRDLWGDVSWFYCQYFGNETRWTDMGTDGACGMPDGSGLVDDGHVIDNGENELCWKCDSHEIDYFFLCPHRDQCWDGKPVFVPCPDCGEGFELLAGSIDASVATFILPHVWINSSEPMEECRKLCYDDSECNAYFASKLKLCKRARSGIPHEFWQDTEHKFCRRIVLGDGHGQGSPTTGTSYRTVWVLAVLGAILLALVVAFSVLKCPLWKGDAEKPAAGERAKGAETYTV